MKPSLSRWSSSSLVFDDITVEGAGAVRIVVVAAVRRSVVLVPEEIKLAIDPGPRLGQSQERAGEGSSGAEGRQGKQVPVLQGACNLLHRCNRQAGFSDRFKLRREVALGMPKVDRLLHGKPERRSIAEQLASRAAMAGVTPCRPRSTA